MKKNLIAAFALVAILLLAGCQLNKDDPMGGFQPIARISAARDAASGQTMFTLTTPSYSGGRMVMIDAAAAADLPLVGGIIVQVHNAADGTSLEVSKSAENAAGFQTVEGQSYNVEISWCITDNNGYSAAQVTTIPIVASGETQIYADLSYDPAYDNGIEPAAPAYLILPNINGEIYDIANGKPDFLHAPGTLGGPQYIEYILYWGDSGPEYDRNTDTFAVFDIGDVLDDMGYVKDGVLDDMGYVKDGALDDMGFVE